LDTNYQITTKLATALFCKKKKNLNRPKQARTHAIASIAITEQYSTEKVGVQKTCSRWTWDPCFAAHCVVAHERSRVSFEIRAAPAAFFIGGLAA
jgi:hypothetical protein